MHADGLGDLGHGVLPLAVRAGGGVHAADGGGLGGVQLGLAAAGAAAGPGGGQALAGALDDQLALELVDRAEDMADQPPSRRGRADVLRVQCSTGSRTVSERVPQRYRFLRKL